MPDTPITALAQVNPEWLLATLKYTGGDASTRVYALQHTNGDFSLPPAPEPYGLNVTVEGDTFLYSLEAPLHNSETTLKMGGFPVYQVPASYTKVAKWYLTYQPESETSPHLILSKPDIQGWTYIADYTMHPFTPGVSTFNYYLHGRITYRNTLEFAFFDHPVEKTTINSEIEIAEVSYTQVQQRLNKTASSSVLRIATKEESEAKMLDSSGKLIMALEPKCLGVMMNTGNVLVKQKGTTKGSGYGNYYFIYGYLLQYYGHIWIYWSTIQNETLYIVGQPLYTGREQGSVVSWDDFSDTFDGIGITKLTAANIPPTYYDLSYYYHHNYNNPDDPNQILKRTVKRAEMDGFRKAFDSVFSKNPYTFKLYGGADVVWASGRPDLSTFMKDMVATTSLDLKLDLSQQNISLTGGDSLIVAGENTFRGGIYRPHTDDSVKPQPLMAVTFLTPNDDNPGYGHLPGVVNDFVENETACYTLQYSGKIHSIPDIQYSNSGFIPTVTLQGGITGYGYNGVFHEIDENELSDDYIEGMAGISGMCCLHTMNVVQRGKSYDLWISSAGSALTFPVTENDPIFQEFPNVLLPDLPDKGWGAYGPYFRGEGVFYSGFPFYGFIEDTSNPSTPVGPSPVDPDEPPAPPSDPYDPDPEPQPKPDPEPDPRPDPDDPEPDDTDPDPDPSVPSGWTRADITQEGYYYKSGTGATVQLTKVNSQQPFYEFAVQMLNQSGSINAQCGIKLDGTMSGGGSYNYTSGTYYCSYGVTTNGSSFVMDTVSNASSVTAANNTASMSVAHQATVTYSGVESDYITVTSDESLGTYNLFSVTTGGIYTRKLVARSEANKTLYYQVIRTKTVNVNRTALQKALAQKLKSNLPSVTISPTSITGSGLHGTPSLSVAGSLTLQSPSTSTSIRPSLTAGTITFPGYSGTVATVSSSGSSYEYGAADNLQSTTPTISGNISATITSKTINI